MRPLALRLVNGAVVRMLSTDSRRLGVCGRCVRHVHGMGIRCLFITQRVLGCMYVQGFDVTAHVAIGGDVYHCQMDIAVISGTGLLGASPFTMNPFVRVTLLGSDGSKVASGATGAVKRGGDNPKFSKDNVCALPYVCSWRFMSLMSEGAVARLDI